MRSLQASLAVMVALAASGCSGLEGREGGLRIAAPARVTQAVTSTDTELCERLAVDLTVRETSAAGAVVDREPLSSTAPCEWELDDEELLLGRGTYALLVRFVAAGSYNGRPECLDDGADPLWIGASFIEEVAFPFPPGFQGFTDDAFLSYPEDDAALFSIGERLGLAVSGFDVDGDGLDNLVELAGASNPCRPNRPPQVTLAPSAAPYAEGTPLSVTVATLEPDGLQHDVEVTIRHAHGSAFAPEEAVVVLRPYEPETITVDDTPASQSWLLSAAVLDARPDSEAAGSWTVTLLPDEPFVGALTVSAVARQKGGGPAFDEAPAPLTLDVVDEADPLRLLVESQDGDLVVAERLDFAEDGATGSPTTLRIRAESQDIGGGVASGITLDDGPAGLVIGEDLSFTTLTWAPNNDVVQASPGGGYTVTLRFVGEAGETTQGVPLGITPSFNDPPVIADLATVNPNLSPEPFESKRIRFDVIDPDRVSGGVEREPTCAAAVWPEGQSEGCSNACCTGAWTSITCAPDGDIDGDTWHMVATLVPSAQYFTACGERPSFVARLSATDKAPSDALPLEDKSVSTQASCSQGELAQGCRTHVTLLTSDITEAVTVSGWGGTIDGDLNGTTGVLIDAVSGYGVVGVKLERPGIDLLPIARVAVVRLTDPPEVMRLYEETELSRLEETLNHLPAGTVDDVNHRAAVYARRDGAAVMAVIETEPPFDVETWPIATFCPGCTSFECGSPPTTDGEGTVYVPCGRSGHGDVVRIAPDGTQTLANLDADIDGSSGILGSTVIVDEMGGKWLLYPDLDGVALIELATFDDVMPNVVRVDLGAEYSASRVEGFATRADRREAYLAFNQSTTAGQAELHRIRVEGGAPVAEAPIVFGPPSVTNSGALYHRIVLRQPDPAALTDEPDLVLTGARSNLDYTRTMVDVDSWTAVPFPRPAAAYQLDGIAELYETPDPRYYAAVVRGDVQGLYLFPWDPQQEPIVQNLGVPTGSGELKQAWITVNHDLNVLTVNDNDLHIIRFPQAP